MKQKNIFFEVRRLYVYKTFFFLCFIVGGLVFGVEEVSAEAIYISNAGAGASDGSSCDQSRPASWFNISGNWGSGDNKISDNDTVYLCGTITNNSLNMVAYGSVGNPYTITSAPGQTAIIDGQNILDRGISAYYVGSGEVIISNLEIRNIAGTGIEARPGVALKIDNVTVRDVSQNCIGLSGDGAYVKNSTLIGCANNGITSNILSNGLIDNNTITLVEANDGITLHDGTGSNNTISNNTVSGTINENAIDIQPGYSNTIISGNDLSESRLYIIGSGGVNTSIYRNYIHDAARGVYLAAPSSIYYNKMVNLSDDTYGSLGNTGGLYFTTADSSFVYNNTLVEGIQATGRALVYVNSGVDNMSLKNNIFDQNKSQTTLVTFDNPSIGLQSDYNSFNTVHNRLVQSSTTSHANLTAWKATGYDINSMYGEQLFSNSNARNFSLLYNSPLIDAGTSVGLTTDYAGNPIYGTPDIGAYEYQPPHTVGTNKIDIGAGARIYGDGKFRDKEATSSDLADLAVTPQGGFESFDADEVRPEWLDIKNITWESATKQWTESSSSSTLTNTIHTVGDLRANRSYSVNVDGALGLHVTGAECANGFCQSNSEGKIVFTYTGTYSEHTFKVCAVTSVGGGALLNPSTPRGNTPEPSSDEVTLEEEDTAPASETGEVTQSSLPASVFTFTRHLDIGAVGTDVVELQKILRNYGFFTHPTNTGYFGPVTAEAVKQYQMKNGIRAIGIVGPRTLQILNSENSQNPANNSSKGLNTSLFIRLLLVLGIIPEEKVTMAFDALKSL